MVENATDYASLMFRAALKRAICFLGSFIRIRCCFVLRNYRDLVEVVLKNSPSPRAQFIIIENKLPFSTTTVRAFIAATFCCKRYSKFERSDTPASQASLRLAAQRVDDALTAVCVVSVTLNEVFSPRRAESGGEATESSGGSSGGGGGGGFGSSTSVGCSQHCSNSANVWCHIAAT